MTSCPHTMSEMDTAVIDGLCPLCLAAELALLKAELAQAKAMSEAGWGAASVTSDDVMKEVESRLPQTLKELRDELADARAKLAACQDDYMASVKHSHDKHVAYLGQKKSADTARAHLAALVLESEKFKVHKLTCVTRKGYPELECDCGRDALQSAARAAREWLDGVG